MGNHFGQIRQRLGWLLFGLALGLGGATYLVLFAAPARAAPADNKIVGDGTPQSCTDAALRQAATTDGYITFNCGPNPLTIVLTDFIGLWPPGAHQGITVTNLTIDGGGLITLSGGGVTRLFYVDGNLPRVTLTLTNLSLYNAAPADPNPGAVVLNNGNLALNHTLVYSAAGAIFNSGILTVAYSTFYSNTSDYDGAAIANNSNAVTLIASQFVSNTSRYGGAISGGGSWKIWDTLFTGNVATDSGGAAIHTYGGSTLHLSNSTLSGNAGPEGGLNVSEGLAYITNTTFINSNLFITGTASLTMINSLLAGDSANCSGTTPPLSLGHNLDAGNTCGLSAAGDLTNTNPLIGSLADNGGATLTHALLDGSLAIDAGDNDSCPETDQRGVDRPLGAACDIGAYEFVPTNPVASTTIPVEGGVLNPGDGALIQFPAGAVTATIILTYTSQVTPSQPPPTGASILRSFTLEATTTDGQSVSQFAVPITLTIDYTEAELAALGVAEANLNVSFWDGNQWTELLPCPGCGLDVAANRITLMLDHLTEFALVSEPFRLYAPLIRH